jgi:hypothetical protein
VSHIVDRVWLRIDRIKDSLCSSAWTINVCVVPVEPTIVSVEITNLLNSLVSLPVELL